MYAPSLITTIQLQQPPISIFILNETKKKSSRTKGHEYPVAIYFDTSPT
jgi:hypothetical protein